MPGPGAATVALLKSEPARVVGIVAAAVVFVALKFGIVLDPTSVNDAIGVALVPLLGGEFTRARVSPVDSSTPPSA